ncbi:MAG TPA: magnesium transporter [Vicinamibacterales bacterium]|nr:magnesium transporter [Vicinamibacterales bacterium]
MTPTFTVRSPREIRVVLSTLVSTAPVWATTAQPIAELGVAVFVVSGLTHAIVGAWAPWIIAAACALAAAIRAADTETWALLIPGGAAGSTRRAFGERAARGASALLLAERVLFAALATLVIGSYATNAPIATAAFAPLAKHLTALDISTLLAAAIVAFFWIRSRFGLSLAQQTRVNFVWIAIAILIGAITWGLLTPAAAPSRYWWPSLMPAEPGADFMAAGWPWAAGAILAAVAMALPIAGSGDTWSRTANRLPLPRLRYLRQISRLAVISGIALAALPALLLTKLVPAESVAAWTDLPLLGLVHHVAGPGWAHVLMGLLVATAAALMLGPPAHAAMSVADQTIRRLAIARSLPEAFGELHPRYGTPMRASDVTAAVTILILVASAGRVSWLGQAYALVLGLVILTNVAALIRLRSKGATTTGAFRVPLNLGARIPLGLWLIGGSVTASVIALIARSLPGLLAPLALIGAFVALVIAPRREPGAVGADAELPDLLPAVDLSVERAHARPGGLLVPVRNPHGLDHLVRALESSSGRDVVVVSVRLQGLDGADSDLDPHTNLTHDEQALFAAVVSAAERVGRTVELMTVSAQNVFDAVTDTAIRLRSAEIHVGESASLTVDAQARFMGDAWERAAKPDDLSVQLVIHHRSGRHDVYHLGAHAPSLRPSDLDLIHRLWLDATRSVGPHVHHHDIVRTALKHMDQQMSGPERDQALALLREVARPADELASAVRARDFARLRDMTRNRPASDLAELLTTLGVEDQVVVFRVLPRTLAAEVFEYLSLESQAALVKGMAQEDVAALLNDMADDDRTRFLEELPAAATRQLLTLLNDAERGIAVSLLGYPPDSVGRLMTSHYVAIRESWTIQQVLDYIRQHGQDSETLNVIYVVDDKSVLIDDIRTRELLLSPLDRRISELMDRRFVALKATDDQKTAVAEFRQHDRTALPVTDSAGVLIGIVTIDDVLDVAEAAATKDIQRIGGSEALDEPYMEISFARMIRKRAGWLTALFLGEMLTATAMKAFEAEIAKAVVLALFVPLIISSGGNSGSQASTLVVRALALGEVTLRDWWRVIRREFFAGATLGGILGLIGFLRITVWSVFDPGQYGPHWPLVGLTVGITLIGIVVWGTLIGSLLPLILRRLGFDPATSSAPFVATLVDVTGLVIYFTVALVTLRGTLL